MTSRKKAYNSIARSFSHFICFFSNKVNDNNNNNNDDDNNNNNNKNK